MRLAAGARRGRTSMRPFLAGWYVSPSGTAGGNGTPASPWSLTYACSGAGGAIQPGDTVWMRGGTYTDTAFTETQTGVMYDLTLNGTAGNPITFRSYPGEWAVFRDFRRFDGLQTPVAHLVRLQGAYLILRDCELWCDQPLREFVNIGWMGGQLEMRSPGGKLINVLVHDVPQTGVWAPASNCEIIGFVSWNYSVCNAASNERGHGFYTQSASPATKTFEDCHLLGGYGYNWHLYTTQADNLHGFTMTGCSSLDGNILNYGQVENPSPGGFDIWGGSSGGKPITNATWDGWFSDALGHRVDEPTPTDFPDTLRIRNSVLGPKPTTTNPRALQWNGVTNIKEVKNNIFIKGGDRVTSDAGFPVVDYGPSDAPRTGSFSPASPSDIDHNLLHGFQAANLAFYGNSLTHQTLAQWQAETGYDLNSQYVNMRNNPANYPEPVVSIVANPKEQGRATIRMYKRPDDAAHTFLASTSGLAGPVGVSLDDVLDDGDTYYLYDARNPLAGAFQTGTYRAGIGINVTFGDMPGRATPNGWSTAPSGNQATHPVIIVRKVGPTWVAPPLALAIT